MSAFADLKPEWFKAKWRRESFLAVLCLSQFVLGIIMVTNVSTLTTQANVFFCESKLGFVIFSGRCVCFEYLRQLRGSRLEHAIYKFLRVHNHCVDIRHSPVLEHSL